MPDRRGDVGADGSGDDRAAEGLAHLQAAAKELIQAARAMLDVAEDLVDDPGAVTVVADTVGTFVRTAASAGRRAAGMDDPGDADPGGRGDRDAPDRGVKRIRIR